MKKVAALFFAFSLFACVDSLPGEGIESTNEELFFGSFVQPPDGYDKYFFFIARASFDLSTPNPEIPNCENGGGICQSDLFFTDIMQYTPQEVLAEEARAKDWFVDRFGIDVDDPANADKIEFFQWTADSRVDFRSYYISGRFVPSDGFEVRDGGFAVRVIDPDGFTLGGEFSGREVPLGTFGLYGNYNILVTNIFGIPKDEINLFYRSDTMIEPIVGDAGPTGIISAVSCQLSPNNFPNDELEGFIRIFTESNLRPDGIFELTSRHSLTIGGSGPRLF